MLVHSALTNVNKHNVWLYNTLTNAEINIY